jgi:hypothetical protein
MSITFLHIFCAVKWGKMNRLGIPYYLLNPFSRVNYVAARKKDDERKLDKPLIRTGRSINSKKNVAGRKVKEVRRGLIHLIQEK